MGFGGSPVQSGPAIYSNAMCHMGLQSTRTLTWPRFWEADEIRL